MCHYPVPVLIPVPLSVGPGDTSYFPQVLCGTFKKSISKKIDDTYNMWLKHRHTNRED